MGILVYNEINRTHTRIMHSVAWSTQSAIMNEWLRCYGQQSALSLNTARLASTVDAVIHTMVDLEQAI